MNIFNRARVSDSPASEDAKIKRYVHSPLTVEHNGVNASIKENGKVVLSKSAGKDDKGADLYDEVEIPASLVFKLASLLKATRKVKFMSLSEVEKTSSAAAETD